MIANKYSQYYNVKNGSFRLAYGLKSLKDIKQILIEASKNHSISTINLGGRYVDVEDIIHISEFLRTNSITINLNLPNCEIRLKGLKYLLNALKDNTTVKGLNLKNNLIGPRGVKCIVDFLKVNTTVTELNLEYNKIGINGARYLSEELKVNTNITSLALGENYKKDQEDQGNRYIAEGLKINNTITSLTITESKGLKHIADALKINTSISTVQIKQCNTYEEVVVDLADALIVNKTLTNIDFRIWNSTLEKWQYFTDALKTNKTLTNISLDRKCTFPKKLLIKGFLDVLKVNINITSANFIAASFKDAFSYTKAKEYLFFNNVYKCIKDYVLGTNEPKFAEHGELSNIVNIIKYLKVSTEYDAKYLEYIGTDTRISFKKIDALFNIRKIKSMFNFFNQEEVSNQKSSYDKIKLAKEELLSIYKAPQGVIDKINEKTVRFEELNTKLSKAWLGKVYSKYVKKNIFDFLKFEDIKNTFGIADRNVELDVRDIQNEGVQQNIDAECSGGSSDIYDVD